MPARGPAREPNDPALAVARRRVAINQSATQPVEVQFPFELELVSALFSPR
jgi:hypothetical protein